jgi:hypothetical protein
MSAVLGYLAIEQRKQHLVEYAERFVSVSWREAAARRAQQARRQAATNALCEPSRRSSHRMYHAWIDEQRAEVLCKIGGGDQAGGRSRPGRRPGPALAPQDVQTHIRALVPR